MPNVDEGRFQYQFPANWIAVNFDKLTFYEKHFQSVAGGTKAVDVVTVEPRSKTLWLIEAKDFCAHPRGKLLPLEQELAEKVRGTLACLMAGRANAGDTGDANNDGLWKTAMMLVKIRVVLHVEQPPTRSRLFPQSVDPKTIKDILKRSVRVFDSLPIGEGSLSINGRGFGWQVVEL